MKKNLLSYAVHNSKDIKEILYYEHQKDLELPLFLSKIYAGKPAEISDTISIKTDLNSLIVKNPESTIILKVSGDSMENAGITDNDLVVVDRSVRECENKIVIASLDGELTMKRLKKIYDKFYLCPENNKYPPIEIKDDSDFRIIGVVLVSLKQH